MEESVRSMNPWMLHLQKLALELKCPLCLQLFKQPVLLPCNHIFCNLCQNGPECPACKHAYIDQEVKHVPFMENIVAIYRNLEATFKANVIHPVCSDVSNASAQCSASLKTDANNNLRKENNVIVKEGKLVTPESVKIQEFKMSGCDKPSHSRSRVQAAHDKRRETGANGGVFMKMGPPSPSSSSDCQEIDVNCRDPNVSHKNSARYSSKRAAENDAYRKRLESKGKKHKKTSSGSDGLVNGHFQTKDLASENVAATCCKSEIKHEKPVSGRQSNQLGPKTSLCAFCHSSKITDGSGALVSYAQGKQVVANAAEFSKITYVHEKCVQWAPRIYFKDGSIKNLKSEIARAKKLKCSSCGELGAVLGCYAKSCQKTYHVPCAYDIFDCRWDCVDYLVLCPNHISQKFPREQKSKAKKQAIEKGISTNLNPCTTLQRDGKSLVLCGSALSIEQKFTMVDFARSNGALVTQYWKDNVTHVIVATDSNGACTRSMKFLMAILNGKWIVTMEWIKACVEAGHVVNEEPYEVQRDTHGCSGGPKSGRLRALNNAPKLFSNMKFYFVGDFVEALKIDLINLVKTGGGTIIATKDQLSSNRFADVKVYGVSLVIYNADFSNCAELEDAGLVKFQRLGAAEDVARECGSRAIAHTWILESVAASSLLPFASKD
ncbi:BRCA1-associated RING domain protein 1-like [Bidens hawaiensis]|uniref:BRCA1-associated RING domain protein 1-like n=1 Tax=Bidens hawaiensis TaxID=980011 RepID=UPI00404B8DB8